MPELPEVETVRKELNKKIRGKTIVGVDYDTPKMLRPSAKEFVAGVQGKIVRDVSRRAKLLIFTLESKEFFVCHLKLTGRLLFRRNTDSKDDYVHVVLLFEDGTELRFSSSRKFGYFQYFKNKAALDTVLKDFGPEPLKSLKLAVFKDILCATGRKIKVVLMDQRAVSGIGNIYANDALWLAGIHPKQPANKISRAKAARLYEAIVKVLKEGLKYQGASDQWFLRTDGSRGRYQKYFKVYRREGEPCLKCGGKIKYEKIGGRGTFWCPRCQKHSP